MSLRNQLETLASTFAAAAIEAIRSVPLDELVAEMHGRKALLTAAVAAAAPKKRGRPPGPAKAKPAAVAAPKATPTKKPVAKSAKGGRLARRSDEDIADLANSIVAICAKHPDGLRAEQIRNLLDVDVKEMPRPIKYALEKRLLKTTGQKRATTYFVRGKTGPKAGAKAAKVAKAAKPTGKRRGRPPGSKNAVKVKPVEAEVVETEAETNEEAPPSVEEKLPAVFAPEQLTEGAEAWNGT